MSPRSRPISSLLRRLNAGHPKAHFGTVQVLLLLVAVGAAVGVVHQFHVGHFQAF